VDGGGHSGHGRVSGADTEREGEDSVVARIRAHRLMGKAFSAKGPEHPGMVLLF
jgi:hypothetical protein